MGINYQWLRYWWPAFLMLFAGSVAFSIGVLSVLDPPDRSTALLLGGLFVLPAILVFFWTAKWLQAQVTHQIRTAEAKYRVLLESTGEGILGVATDGRIVFGNAAAGALLGYRPEDILGRPIHELFRRKRSDGTIVTAQDGPIVRACRTGESVHMELELWRENGTSFIADCSSYPVREGGPTGAVVTFTDITAKKLAEEELRESEERYRKLLGASFEAIVIHNNEGVILEVNHAFEVIFGIPGTLAAGLPILAFLAQDSREVLLAQIRQGNASPYEGVGLRMDGTLLSLELVTRAHTYKGKPIRVTAIRNITQRKRGEHRQRVQLAISQILVEAGSLDEAMPHLLEAICHTMEWDLGNVWLVDREEQVLHWVTKWEAAELQAEAFDSVTRDLRFHAGEGLPGQVWQTGRPSWIQDFSQEMHLPRAAVAGTVGLCAAFAFPIGTGSDIYGVIECFSREVRRPDPDVFEMMTDIGIKIGQFLERKQAEEALRQSEEQLRQAVKLEAIGRLAGGIAHDFNNILTVITGYSSMLVSTLAADSMPRSAVSEILKAASRAGALTSQLLAFSRRQMLQPRILDMNAVVASMEHLLRRLISEDVELVTIQHAGLGVIRADLGQLEQVIMNLALNARDAMSGGGRLTIETDNLELPEPAHGKTHHLAPGSYVTLTVRDTGCGMDAETQARIFEPFFTTKEKGKGTGLGLSTVYGIVEQSGGHIDVTSAPGQGTSFTVYLPRVEGVSESIEPEMPILGPVGGSETILLVEDEPMVRDLVHRVLERYGYTVLDTSHPEEAVRMVRECKKPIHLIVTDVVMPRMSGRELTSRLRELRPGVRVLYMSGYTENLTDVPEVLDAGSGFVQKPFSPEYLAQKVREILDMPAIGSRAVPRPVR